MGKFRFSSIEERGRIVIPKSLRERLNLKMGHNLLIESRDKEIILKPMIDVKVFSSELRGCVKKPRIRPEDVKKIWGMK